MPPPAGYRSVALFGPSYVGKTTFLSAASRRDFLIAPLITDRPPRDGEPDDGTGMAIVTAGGFDRRIAASSWFVFRSAGYRYGLDLGTAAVRLSQAHVILGISPTRAEELRRRLPSLVGVLMWPADFDSMQAALLRCPQRSSGERWSRYWRNQRMRSDIPAADIILRVPRVTDAAAIRAVHERLVTQLLAALAHLPGTD